MVQGVVSDNILQAATLSSHSNTSGDTTKIATNVAQWIQYAVETKSSERQQSSIDHQQGEWHYERPMKQSVTSTYFAPKNEVLREETQKDC